MYILIQLFCPFLSHLLVAVAGHESRTTPTEGGTNGIVVVEATHPRGCGGVSVCFNFLVLLKLVFISYG